MTPKNRERAYEKRRYEEWQDRLAVKQRRNRELRRRLAIVGGAVAGVLVIVAAFLLVNEGDDDDGATTTASSTAEASATSDAAATTAATDAKSTCPTVDVTAPATPQQFDEAPDKSLAENKTWTLNVKTTCGDITISLDGKAAPQAVSSMIKLAQAGFYDGSPCHRLTTSDSFELLQCGDPTGTGTGSPGYSYGPIENAPSDQVYEAGTVAMARASGDGDSNGSQFFLVYGDTSIPDDAAGGYTVLGKITKGLDVVKKVAEGGVADGSADGTPVSAVSIESTTVSG
ncbi:peptidylprolyl isomerase [Kineosporia sp. J2-2]|uniref:Peptidylprolyl isomerase n=1 Tax=Kineosporia corallincola TaxID=2835133 RepID=A0ABS5TH88_9ACTN|nr:peptidylprolyl isomerase [Kineosporia corallincola]MBT0768969.1 peptidylprolyl isomerase [Kineosporia corallincola]